MADQPSKGEGGTSAKEDAVAAGMEISTNEEKDGTSDLFAPPPPREACPICMVTLPIVPSDSLYMECCGKLICCGCELEHERVIKETNARNARRNRDQGRAPLVKSCAFCREVPPSTHEENLSRLQKRMELGDASAFHHIGVIYRTGKHGLPKDERKAFEFYLRAAELGFAQSCSNVALCYRFGKGVEKDEVKYRMYLEKGAKAGSVRARNDLGVLECINGNVDLAVKHFLISASAGWQPSLDNIKELYKKGIVSKDDFEDALRSSFAAKKEEWSKERDKWAAEKARRADDKDILLKIKALISLF